MFVSLWEKQRLLCPAPPRPRGSLAQEVRAKSGVPGPLATWKAQTPSAHQGTECGSRPWAVPPHVRQAPGTRLGASCSALALSGGGSWPLLGAGFKMPIKRCLKGYLSDFNNASGWWDFFHIFLLPLYLFVISFNIHILSTKL